MRRLLSLLDSYPIGDPKLEDELIWIRDEEGGFSVKSVRGAVSSEAGDFMWNLCLESSNPTQSESLCGNYGGIVLPLLTTLLCGV